MHRRNSRRTALVLSAAAIAAVPALTACGSEAHPGAAAVVGGQRITVSQLESRVNEVRDAQQTATKDSAQYEQAIAKTGGLTRNTLHTMVLDRVLHRAATDAGISVTRKEMQSMRSGLEQQAGGAKALEVAWLQQYNIPPNRLTESLRTEIEAQKLSTALGADMQTPQGKAVFWKALSSASKELNVDLNPRYGTWDVTKNSRVDAKTPWLKQITKEAPAQQQTT
ncbi:SurA N-terminal domain-containing protein [Streptomyces sp. NBC_00006]|uniref:SurA N-terminal domain-containing protein n=1 Tax=unclassified Streptomyces TaxID=2593676 RepID=UPI002256BA04|nr:MULTISPECIES: SurA N-terminal domain-containing protein [unclassified Streptomyces]MCX4827493.1 SurA N-terminal domain-containing protein [Streptomyces sp. NBC_01016]MCX5533094.1 SurA N-terminal domain-containing protein [Streptomyces sp. NBC_00006]